MQFSKIRMTGFKSFVDPVEVWIEKGLTGIVGPNGCGKSNLVEALRWAMGETSARKIRGGEMDDVIFAGTDNRPARNLAEVSLQLDNADRTAPSSFNSADEIEVVRRIERGAGSSYRINGHDARARDVQLMFADVATGARSPALVSQGRIGALVNAKPVERRLLLEEAAGTTGLHSRRHEAELRLKAAEGNLERLDDVMATLDTQLQGLKRQARQARRYRRLAGHIRKQEAMLFYLRWQEATERLASARESLAAAESEVADATRAAAGEATRQAEAAGILPDLRQKEAAAAAELHRLTVALDQLVEEENRVEAAKADASQRQAQIAADRERESARQNDATRALAGLEEEKTTISPEQENEAGAREKAAVEAREAVNRVEDAEAKLNDLLEEIAAADARATSLARQREDAAARLQRLAQRAETLDAQGAELRAAGIDLARLEQADRELLEAEGTVEAAKARADEAEAAWRAAQVEEARIRDELQRAQEAHTRLAAEEDALGDLLSDGFDQSEFPSVLDSLSVEAGFEDALGAAFGDDLIAALSGEAPVHWHTSEWENGTGAAPALPAGATPLSAHVDAPGALQRRLAQIGVVADSMTARRLQGTLAQGQRLVTRAGGLWRWDGFTVTPGSATAAATRLVQRSRLESVRAEVGDAKARLQTAQDAFEAARSKAAAAVGDATRAQNQLRDAYGALQATQSRNASLRQKNEGQASRLSALQDSIRDLTAEREAAEAEVRELEAARAALPDLGARRDEAARRRTELGERRAAYMERQTILNQFTQRAETRRERLQRIAGEITNWTQRRDDAEHQLSQLEARREAVEKELETLAHAPARIAAKRDELAGLIETARATRQESADRLTEAEEALQAADRALRVAESRLADAREGRIRREAAVEQGEQAIQSLTTRMRERIDASPGQVAEVAEITPEDALPEMDQVEEKLERLVRERERLGAVNLRAEEEAEELEARLTGMQTERTDLVDAIARLRQGIQNLNREGRERLLRAFEQVDGHFQKIFGRLFGGGKAYMKLVESDDPLQAGLEIFASPPGKKLQSLSLLSGGEQALTGLAMLFAVFLTNPAPICVLDEVDAPLDDANVDRFCSLLEELSESMNTRFLVVTHHRMTMARMDRLFGVTMAERGVSQVVSVNLHQAEKIRESV